MKTRKPLSLFLAMLLAVALCAATALSGCQRSGGAGTITSSQQVGQGQTTFTFQVTVDDETTEFAVSTDKKTVGEALLDNALIAGSQESYGLYVTEVNGLTLDYNKDGAYWALYVNGEYATSGVDATDINAGDVYEFRKES
ncbi:MAG: DUF4430 domain-containing protein [Clostridiales bacterium]|nr:DUF4430 domain-containing protein [Clostridiales bacterium]